MPSERDPRIISALCRTMYNVSASPGAVLAGPSPAGRLAAVRRLLPLPPAEDVDLHEAYGYPADRPWVRANMVSSADGAAAVDGRSGMLTGAADKRVFRALRGLADVVLVGAGTVRSEGYRPIRAYPASQEHRAALGQPPAPALAVVTGRIDLDLDGPLFTAADARTIVITCAAADPGQLTLARERAEVVVTGADTVDLAGAVAALGDRGLGRILCEGGPRLLGQVAAAGLLDELCLTVSPLMVAGGGPRIAQGPAASVGLRLQGLLEEDGILFTRYARTA